MQAANRYIGQRPKSQKSTVGRSQQTTDPWSIEYFAHLKNLLGAGADNPSRFVRQPPQLTRSTSKGRESAHESNAHVLEPIYVFTCIG
jgi:hypothetical protein